ncbi:MAG: glycoside hydrolase family 3 C-terminal domain-containing protein, partial [Bifidobacteriaceae bacterium]|nr:glycoside hydrolase family 3 C-terminal domain-containing protein [Bifidobacteriaceae bacterium]
MEDLSSLSLIEKAALVTGRTTWQTHPSPRVGLRSIWLSDGPHGVRRQAGRADHLGLNPSHPATCFPPAAAIANSWDVELAEQIGAALGAEARAQGVDVLLGPGLNIKRSPLGGRNFEYFSEDPLLSGKLAAAYVRGIQSRGVAACPKHFAANNQELRRMASDSLVDQRTLREIYLAGFEIVVREARPWAIMSSYNLVGGVYASENKGLLTDVLRDEWGFDGAVVTDWGGSNDIVAGLKAGCSLEMPAAGYASVRQIEAAVNDGRLAEADLDARAQEVAALVRRSPQGDQTASGDYDAHHKLARRAAAAGAVLLKNQGDILPLAPGTKVALVGDFAAKPRYQAGGSSAVNPTRLDNALDLLAESGLVLASYSRGFRRDGRPDPAAAEAAAAAAGQADVVLAWLGLDESAECEGADRSDLNLPPVQVDLLAALAEANPRIVVVLSAGGAVETPWLDHCQALLYGCLAGQAGAGGLLDVLVGNVNPSGRLAETFPLRLADHPTAGHFPAVGRAAQYREGIYVGYRYFVTAGQPVAFPFGFGLSYTTFAYSDLAAGPAGLEVTVTNTGARAGAEVVQAYVHRLSGGVYRPHRELRGFARVELAVGESARVAIALGDAAFRHFDAAGGDWVVEDGLYEIQVGANVNDIRLTAPVTVCGTQPATDPDPDLLSYNSGQVRRVGGQEFERLLGRPLPTEPPQAAIGPDDLVGALAWAPSRVGRFAYRLLRRRLDRAE